MKLADSHYYVLKEKDKDFVWTNVIYSTRKDAQRKKESVYRKIQNYKEREEFIHSLDSLEIIKISISRYN